MSEWAAKRFWTDVTVAPLDGGWQVLLDGRGVKSPAKADLVLPSEAYAHAVAAEWDAQEGQIAPLTMPFTRTANAALDKVRPQQEAVAQMLAAYGATDLLCYRAAEPEALQQRQAAAWDPLLDWVQERFDLRLVTAAGVMHVAQPPQTEAVLGAPLHVASPFRLAALHDLISLSGSLVLALAVAEGRLTVAEAWDLSRLDEDWQIEHWGEDDEATRAAQQKRDQFFHADAVLRHIG